MPIKSQLALRSLDEAGGRLLQLSGVVDGLVEEALIAARTNREMVLDCDAVSRVSSYGVRAWMTAMGQLTTLSPYVAIIRMRADVLGAFNVVPRSLSGIHLLSFYMPYRCTQCDIEIDRLVDVRHQHGALVSGALATCTCEACGGLAEFDDIPLLYMPHIAGVPPNPSPIVTALQGRAQHLELMPVVQEGLTTARQQAASALDAITNLLDARKQTR